MASGGHLASHERRGKYPPQATDIVANSVLAYTKAVR